MWEVLVAILGPTVVFGLFALLAVRFGAESRPYFDERPVVDDRPNWFPIAGSAAAGAEDADDAQTPDAEPVPEPVVRRQPVARPLASPTSAASSPSGV